MDSKEIKTALHNLINNIEDEVTLENIYDAFSNYAKSKNSDDELTSEQKFRLEESLEQYYSGKTISHEAMKTEIGKWHTK